jgi:hypothetical protein
VVDDAKARRETVGRKSVDASMGTQAASVSTGEAAVSVMIDE